MSGLNSGSRSVSRSRGNRLNTAANAMGASGRAQAEVDAVTKRGVTVIRAGDVQPVGFREVRWVAIERELHQPVHPRLAVPQGRELEAARARGGQLAQSFGLQRIEVDGLIFAMPFEPAEPDERSGVLSAAGHNLKRHHLGVAYLFPCTFPRYWRLLASASNLAMRFR